MTGIEIRHIKQAEYRQAKALWDVCFPEDANGYSDYYFARRTKAEYVLAAFYNGEMVAALHTVPYPLNFAKSIKPCVMVAGVATLPQHRHKGIAAGLIRHCHGEQKRQGTVAALLKPDVDFYAQFGYVPFALHDEYSLCCQNAGAVASLHMPCEKELADIYKNYAKGYLGMMVRSEEYMAAYMEEARCTGARVLSNGSAYAFFAENDGVAEMYELVGQDVSELLYSIAREYGNVRFRIPKGEKTVEGASFIKTTMFSMLCPLDENGLVEGTGAKNIEELLSGACGKPNTLEFC